MIKQTLSKNITHYRNKKGMSQSALGEAIGVGRSLICDYEKGRTALSLTQLEKVAEALEVEPYKLIKE